MKRMAGILEYLDIDAQELRQLAIWAAMLMTLSAALIMVALIAGTAVRVFTCAGGITC